MKPTRLAPALAAASLFSGCSGSRSHTDSALVTPPATSEVPAVSCFLLYELGVGEVRRAPAIGCGDRVSPASTFKIPHALAALDSGVVADASTTFEYDGAPVPFPSWQRDHTLASAMKYSVVWYFQRIADALGPVREHEYLAKFQYGNEDASHTPRRFWIAGSLLVSPDEQERFLVKFFEGALPASPRALSTVRDLLVQPEGVIMNAMGEHEFARPWRPGTTLRAKTGNARYADGVGVQWLVGSVERGSRTWVFVSCVTGRFDAHGMPAADLAARALREERIL